MRTAFINALVEEAERDERVWLLCGDLGYSVLEVFAERFPSRFLNVGIAEQNMVGVAAGLAMSGMRVFTYSIANFSTLRCLEQIRNDVAYPKLSVVAVSVGGGLAYGSLGYSHHAVEDLAIMRSLPNMQVLAPGDPFETRAAVKTLVTRGGPGYLRLGKANEPAIHLSEPSLSPGEPLVLRNGSQVTLVSTGGVLALALEAADQLAAQGVDPEVLSLPFMNPLTPDQAAKIGNRTGRLVTIEEHGMGGLGGSMAENLCLAMSNAKLLPIALQGSPISSSGSQAHLRSCLGVSAERVVAASLTLLAA